MVLFVWVIAFYFINDPELAILLSHSRSIGDDAAHSYTILARHLRCRVGLAIALALLLDEPQWLTILIASGLSIPATLFAKRYYYGDQNRHLLVMASIIMVTSLINVAVVGSHVPATYMVCGW